MRASQSADLCQQVQNGAETGDRRFCENDSRRHKSAQNLSKAHETLKYDNIIIIIIEDETMKEQEIIYTTALNKMFKAAKRFRGQIEQFRDANIGNEIWDAIHGGSMLPSSLSCAQIGSEMLLKELWKLGPVRRERLHKQDSVLHEALTEDGWKLAFEGIHVTGVVDSRVQYVLVAYHPHSALNEASVRTKVEVAITATVSDDPKGTLYASDLKLHLEDEGLYGIALQDMREGEFDWLLARVIAMGRLNKYMNTRLK